MTSERFEEKTGQELTARLDRLSGWPYPTFVLWVIGVGYFMAFFDITNIAFGLPVFSKLFHMTAAQEAYPISSSLFGYILGAWLNSNLADAVGRKLGIVLATVLFSIGCLGSTFSDSLESLVIWRFITGMGIGAEIAIISTYIGEIAPASVRGRYTGWANVFSFLGLAIVPVAALGLVPNFAWGWRAMFLIGALGLVTLIAFPYLPESPRWLVGKRRYAEAQAIIEIAEQRVRRLTGAPLAEIGASVPEAEVHGFPTAHLLRPPYVGRVLLLLALWIVWYIGEYAWLGLGPTFFIDRGYTLTHSIIFMLMSSLGLPVGALLSAWLGDHFERKYAIFAGMIIWIASFVVIAFITNSMAIYVAVFTLTAALGYIIPLMYTLTAESFLTSARATGVSLTDGIGHFGGAAGPVLATMVYAWGGKSFGFESVFLFIAVIGLIAACILPFSVSATGKPLESVSRDLHEGI
jgi:MFS transporter, putative metabolite:H+ symporter